MKTSKIEGTINVCENCGRTSLLTDTTHHNPHLIQVNSAFCTLCDPEGKKERNQIPVYDWKFRPKTMSRKNKQLFQYALDLAFDNNTYRIH